MQPVYATIILALSVLFLSLPTLAGPGRTTYQAKIIKPDGLPLEASTVNFKFTILDPAGACILYSETFSSVNMSNTSGLISFSLGSGVKTYPASATTFEQVFSNITPSLSCDTGGPVSYSPAVTDIRKIVMQFHDGSGWQTLPAMSINAVPYAMYANEAQTLNGLTSGDFVQLSTVPTCTASEALRYTGAGFTCVATGGSGSVTSGAVITALGYTPADGASVTTLTSNFSSVSSTIFSVSSTVTSLQSSVAASFAAITSSQWTTSGTNIFYNAGNVGIGTASPPNKLTVAGNANFTANVGIGTTTPNGPLHIYGTGRPRIESSGNPAYLDLFGGFGNSSARNYSLSVNAAAIGNFDILQSPSSGIDPSVAVLSINASGSVGIGTTTPVTKLDVSGGVRIGSENTTCAPALAGTLRYNASNVEYCNGISWQAFGVSGAGITNFNGSTSGTQSFAVGTGGTAPNFNTSNGVHTLNIPLASAGSVTAGLLSNADYTTFSNKITSSAASIAQVLGYVPADNSVSGAYAQKANNLSDLTNIVTARTNLGLGTFATASTVDLGGASATGTLAIARLPNFTGDATIAAASNTVILSNSGVTAGTYTKVTVDTKGRVTSGTQMSSSDVTTALGYTPASATASTQWTTSGANIFYNTGNVGIGTTTPQERLHTSGTMLVTGEWGSGPTLTVSGAGTRMFFYPRKAAFRGGYAYDDEWNEGNLGEGSFAYGDSVAASGAYSVAMGRNSRATAPYATAFGQGDASGDYSTAFDSSTASGLYSFAFGSSSANADRAIAMGGGSSANGESSVAIGRVVLSNAYRNVAVGSYNIGSGSGTAWIATDPIFEIGNSQNGLPRTNAMTVLKNGNVGVTVSAPTARLHLASGTTSVAPLKFTTGTLLSSPQSGTMEYDGSNFYLTDSTNTRRSIATGSSAGTIDNASNINSSGNITMTPTGSVVVSSTTASTNSSTGALVVKGGLGVAGNIYTSGTIITSSNIQGASVTATNGMISPYIAGSIGSGGSLTLDSTTHATKGNIYLAPNGGNVGIGTTTPTTTFVVSGVATFTKNASGGSFDSTIISKAPNGQLQFGSHGSVNKIVPANLAGSAAQTLYLEGPVADSIPQIYMRTEDLTVTGTNPVVNVGTSRVHSNGSSYLMGGNVGIGTISPGQKLEVSGTIKATANIFAGDGTVTAPSIAFGNNTQTGFYRPGANVIGLAIAGSEKLRVDSSGNVGIGTTTPGAPLEIKGQTAAPAQGLLLTTNTYTSGTAGSYVRIGHGASSGNTYGEIDSLTTGGTVYGNLVLQAGGGSVGIGTTSPGANTKLDVNGQIRTPASSLTTGAIDWSAGNAATTSFDCGSNITFANMRQGGAYTLVVTGTGTTQCTFSTTTTGDDAATVSYRFLPANGNRTASSHTLYSLQRIGNIVYVSWMTGF